MSSFKVPVVMIQKVEHHPNADKLDLVHIAGWVCVAGRDQYKPGDLAVYIPIDSVLPLTLEQKLFPPEQKIQLSKHRVKSIKIRGCVSQGMLMAYDEARAHCGAKRHWATGYDVAADLGVTKYAPPVKQVQGPQRKKKKRKDHPEFAKFTDLENIKWYPTVFADDELVVVTEKLHGTNFRAGWLPYNADTWWKKLLVWARLAPDYEFVYGSRNVQLQDKPANKSGYYAKTIGNVYLEAVQQYDLMNRIPKGHVVFGEIVGDGVQPGYTYGCGKGERKLYCFDVMKQGKYCNAPTARMLATNWGLSWVPVLYQGRYNAPHMQTLVKGDSMVADQKQRVREGVVIRPVQEKTAQCGRKILKMINDDYLLGKWADQEQAHDQVAA